MIIGGQIGEVRVIGFEPAHCRASCERRTITRPFQIFLLNAVRSLYLTGNAYALALRNHKYEIDELHLFDSNQSGPHVIRSDNEANGEIFYQLRGNDVIEARLATNDPDQRWLMVPQRDVLYIRLHGEQQNPRPLVGETPLTAAFGDMSDVRSDEEPLKVMPWTAPSPSKDLQLAELLQLTDQHIALVFRIPLQILGLGSAPLGSTETLMSFWLASVAFCSRWHSSGKTGSRDRHIRRRAPSY